MPFPSFQDVSQSTAEPLLIWLEAEANTGKSTLCASLFRLFHPGVVIPSDQRAKMYYDLRKEGIEVHPITANPTDWNDEDKTLAALRENMPGSDVKVIVWDSLSPKFRELIVDGLDIAEMTAKQRKAATGNPNKTAAYQKKARFMEKVSSIAKYGTHVVWVAHEFIGGDKDGKPVTKTTITKQERAKFERNLNLQLRTGQEGGKYYVEIVWARERPELRGKKLYDDVGMFKDMWQRIIQAFEGAQVVVFDDVPFWPSPEDAIKAGLEVSVDGVSAFSHLNHARNAYEQVREKVVEKMTDEWKKKNAKDLKAAAKLMAEEWKAEVYNRIANKAADLSAAGDEQPTLIDAPEAPEPYPD